MVGRQGSNSACSTDSGYPKSLESSTIPCGGFDLSTISAKYGEYICPLFATALYVLKIIRFFFKFYDRK